MKTLANAMSVLMLAVLVAIVTMLAALFSPAMAGPDNSERLAPMPISEFLARIGDLRTRPLMPPPEYEKPHGNIFITVLQFDDPYEVLKRCPKGKSPIACSFASNGNCLIVRVSDDYLRKAGVSVDYIMRHELAHCPPNFWPGDHPGGRIPTADDLAKR